MKFFAENHFKVLALFFLMAVSSAAVFAKSDALTSAWESFSASVKSNALNIEEIKQKDHIRLHGDYVKPLKNFLDKTEKILKAKDSKKESEQQMKATALQMQSYIQTSLGMLTECAAGKFSQFELCHRILMVQYNQMDLTMQSYAESIGAINKKERGKTATKVVLLILVAGVAAFGVTRIPRDRLDEIKDSLGDLFKNTKEKIDSYTADWSEKKSAKKNQDAPKSPALKKQATELFDNFKKKEEKPKKAADKAKEIPKRKQNKIKYKPVYLTEKNLRESEFKNLLNSLCKNFASSTNIRCNFYVQNASMLEDMTNDEKMHIYNALQDMLVNSAVNTSVRETTIITREGTFDFGGDSTTGGFIFINDDGYRYDSSSPEYANYKKSLGEICKSLAEVDTQILVTSLDENSTQLCIKLPN